ncbi:hypothetical protein ACFFUB_00825 [Algimonas porphyrae]|uniref:hypothetical protein n=1 Tax=Algimonas porphyrae TaxID=1128113 RepID=UPI0024E1666E|nr:hypothetical protein [Algimonas porphyrae]
MIVRKQLPSSGEPLSKLEGLARDWRGIGAGKGQDVKKIRRLVRPSFALSACLSCSLMGIALTDAHAADRADLDYTGSIQFMPETGQLTAGWTIQVLDSDLDTITFGLSAALGTAAVSGADVMSVTTTLDPRFDGAIRAYQVDLGAVDGDRPRRVRFAYSGPLFDPEPSFPINTLNSNKVELTVDSFWFPFDLRFDSDLTANLGVRIDGEWSGVGVDQVERVDQGFRIRQRDPALDIAFSLLSNSQIVTSDDYIIHDARREPGTKIDDLTQALEICTTYLNDMAGSAGPLPKASILVTDRAEGGYSRGTLIALTDIENETDTDLQKFICHELAHFWSHANAGGAENWINEGVAEYIALMGVRHAMGEAVYAAYLGDYAERLDGQDLPPIWTPDASGRPPYLISYRAAPLALRDLEERLGRDAFRVLMRVMMIEKIKTTPDLLAAIERLSDKPTRDWFASRLAE